MVKKLLEHFLKNNYDYFWTVMITSKMVFLLRFCEITIEEGVSAFYHIMHFVFIGRIAKNFLKLPQRNAFLNRSLQPCFSSLLLKHNSFRQTGRHWNKL